MESVTSRPDQNHPPGSMKQVFQDSSCSPRGQSFRTHQNQKREAIHSNCATFPTAKSARSRSLNRRGLGVGGVHGSCICGGGPTMPGTRRLWRNGRVALDSRVPSLCEAGKVKGWSDTRKMTSVKGWSARLVESDELNLLIFAFPY